MKNFEIKPVEIIPQPRSIAYSSAILSVGEIREIRVTDTPENRFAARLLRQGIRETKGIDCEIELMQPEEQLTYELYLVKNTGEIPISDCPPIGCKEGYTLTVTTEGVKIDGEDAAGLFYGVQTLIQLFEQAQRDHSSELPGLTIEDWPVYGLRGTYIDSDQFKGSIRVTQRNIEDMIRQVSRFKMNYMILEMYNLMPFESFPYCSDEDTIPVAGWKYMVELAHAHHVILMPSLQSFAQMYDVLWPCEEGKPYRESDDAWPGIICPSRPEGIELLKGLYKDLLNVFKYTPFLGIGCSEVGMGWKNFCPQCQARLDSGETLNDIYEKHICDCIKAVKLVAKDMDMDVRPWMWADEFYMSYDHRDNKNFEGMENIPKDIVMCHWAYWSKIWSDSSIGDYLGIKGLLERGYDVSFASASYLYNSYLLDLSPDVPGETTTDFADVTKKFYLTKDSGIANITDQPKFAHEYQKQLSGNSVLGGVCATFSQHDIKCWDTTWYAYALHADYTWGDPTRSLKDYKEVFTYKFAGMFYKTLDRKPTGVIAQAYLKLDEAKNDIERNNYIIHDVIGEYDIQDNAYIDNTLEKSAAIIRDLIEKEGSSSTTLEDIRTRANSVIDTAGRVRKELAGLALLLRNTSSWAYLITAAKKIENHGTRTIYLIDQEQGLLDYIKSKETGAKDVAVAVKNLEKLAARLQVLKDETRIITDEVNELTWGRGESAAPWSPAGDSTGFNQVLNMLNEFAEHVPGTNQEM